LLGIIIEYPKTLFKFKIYAGAVNVALGETINTFEDSNSTLIDDGGGAGGDSENTRCEKRGAE